MTTLPIITFTRKQKECLEHVLDPMEDFVYHQDCEYTEGDLIVFKLTYLASDELLEDLEYRLVRQWFDIDGSKAWVNTWEKIKQYNEDFSKFIEEEAK